MTSRRKFLLNCSKTMAAAAVIPGVLTTGRPLDFSGRDRLSLETFVRHLRTSFTVSGGSTVPVELELLEAKPWAASGRMIAMGPDARHDTFVLRFRGPSDQHLPQATYFFNHGQMGLSLIHI